MSSGFKCPHMLLGAGGVEAEVDPVLLGRFMVRGQHSSQGAASDRARLCYLGQAVASPSCFSQM